MDNKQYSELQKKLEKADSIKLSISKIDAMLKKFEHIPRCKQLEFEYYDTNGYSGLGFCDEQDEDKGADIRLQINAETLNLCNDEFEEWFTQPIINHLKDLRKKLEDDFKKL